MLLGGTLAFIAASLFELNGVCWSTYDFISADACYDDMNRHPSVCGKAFVKD
jgi:hypothetical protein